MKNFTIITLILAGCSFLLGLVNPEFTFLGLGLAFLLSVISLVKSLKPLHGFVVAITLFLLPGILESYGFSLGVSLFQNPVVQYLTHTTWKFALDPQIVGSLLAIATIFIGAVFLSQQLLQLNITTAHKKLRHTLVATLLITITFINLTGGINVLLIVRWFLISLISVGSISPLLAFTPSEKWYTNLPVVLYYFIPLYTAVGTGNYSMFLLMAIVGATHLFVRILRSPSLKN